MVRHIAIQLWVWTLSTILLSLAAIAKPAPLGIPYQSLLQDEPIVSVENKSNVDSTSRKPNQTVAEQVAHTGSANGPLALLNTAEWRNFTALYFMDGFLYTASPLGILAFDMTDPSHPRQVGQFYHPSPAPDCARELKGANGYLSLLTPTVGLEIIDAAQPSNLHVRGTVLINELKPCGGYYSQIMEQYQNLVYIASASDTLFIIDVANPDAPVVRSAFHDGDAVDIGFTQGIASYMGGNKCIYLSSSYVNTPLTTINVNSPTSPVVASTYWGAIDSLPPFGGKLVRSGDYLFGIGPRWPMTYGWRKDLKVMTLNSSDIGGTPLSPKFVCSTFVTNEYISDFTVADNRLYVGTEPYGHVLCTYDITDPCAPRKLGCAVLDTVLNWTFDKIIVQGNWLYNTGVEYNNGGQPRSMVGASLMSSPVAPQLHLAYTGKPAQSLTASETTPVVVASTYKFGFTHGLLDVSQPTDPQSGGSIDGADYGGLLEGLELQGSILYSAYDCGCYPDGRFAGLDCIDASDPSRPFYRWRFNLGQYRKVKFKDVAAVSPYFYMAAEDSGLYVLQQSAPDQVPQVIATLGIASQTRGVTVIGHHAYIVAWGQNLYGSVYEGAYLTVVDISSPAAPHIVGYQEPWGQFNIEAFGNRFATTSWSLDHWAITLYQPDSTGWPTIIGTYDPPDRQGDLKVLKLHGKYLYANDGGVLDVVDISDPSQPVRVDQYTPLRQLWDVAVRGETVYLSEYDGLRILGGPSCCDGTTGNINLTGIVDLTDLSQLIQYLTMPNAPALVCRAEGDLNNSGVVDLSDLSYLIAYLVGNPKPPLSVCP